MIGRQDRWQEDLFVVGSLKGLIPEDHILRRIDGILDLEWLREELKDCYCEANGRPSIDPEAAVRLMLAGLCLAMVHDRHLLREAHVNLAIRWFAGYRLHEKLPDHSSLTKIRQRWGEKHFKEIFQRTVQSCVKAGLVAGEMIHVDATLIRADVSWDSIVEQRLDKVWQENHGTDQPEITRADEERIAKRSKTDPEATLATSSRRQKAEPSYKQHTTVDDQAGVVLDVIVTTGAVNEGNLIVEQVQRTENNTGIRVRRVTADGKVYRALEERGIDPVIPAKAELQSRSRVPGRRFKYDARHKVVRCPRGKILRRSSYTGGRWYYRSRTEDCRDCPLKSRCLSPGVKRRSIIIGDDHAALLRARRRRHKQDRDFALAYQRHRWRSEGVNAELKLRHGLARAVRRGLANVAMQAYLTAAIINLKRLAG
jgi:IS5 family transposase